MDTSASGLLSNNLFVSKLIEDPFFGLINCLSNCEFKLLTGFDQFTQDKTMKICVKELLWFSHVENEFK